MDTFAKLEKVLYATAESNGIDLKQIIEQEIVNQYMKSILIPSWQTQWN